MTGNFWSLRLEHRNSWRRQKQLWICGKIMFFFLASFNKSVSLILLVAFPPRDHIWFIYIEKNVRLLYQVATNCSDNSDPKVVSQPKKINSLFTPWHRPAIQRPSTPKITEPTPKAPFLEGRRPPPVVGFSFSLASASYEALWFCRTRWIGCRSWHSWHDHRVDNVSIQMYIDA